MSEVIENNLVGDNQPEYSVSEISALLRGLLKVSLNTFGYEVKWSSFKSPIWSYLFGS